MQAIAIPSPFPMPCPDDDEDVHWALSTGAALWARGERDDALRWLRRAAERAADIDDARETQLLRALGGCVSSAPPSRPSSRPSGPPPLPLPGSLRAVSAPRAALRPPPPPRPSSAPPASSARPILASPPELPRPHTAPPPPRLAPRPAPTTPPPPPARAELRAALRRVGAKIELVALAEGAAPPPGSIAVRLSPEGAPDALRALLDR